MAAPSYPQVTEHIDFLLAEVAAILQLTGEQHQLAVQHYGAVAEYLSAQGSPVARFDPLIYPQGSMALETTVRPLRQEEYDLDLVCQLLRTGLDAMSVYNMVYARLMSHNTYATMVEKKNRCIRINYAHDFHLDIIPAEPDVTRGGTAILVPDRSLVSWTPSNPKGFVGWFRGRCAILKRAAKAEAVPSPTPAAQKPALTIAVQLMKRRRDLFFSDATIAPRSVVLTTLAGELFQGTESVVATLAQILAGIQRRVMREAPNRIVVCNPTNGDERFCESFDGPGRYEAFKQFVEQFGREVQGLLSLEGIPQLEERLGVLFGGEPVRKAVKSYGALQKAKRDAGTLKFTGAGLGGVSVLPGSGGTRPVPPNTYFGAA